MKRLRRYPARPNLTLKAVEGKPIIYFLLEILQPVIFNCEIENRFLHFCIEEMKDASQKLENNKAPYPGSISAEVIKFIEQERPTYMLEVFNQLIQKCLFPAE